MMRDVTLLEDKPFGAAPAGFRVNDAGLLVPEAVSRARQAWTHQEIKLLRRCEKMLREHEIDLTLRCLTCARKGETDAFIQAIRLASGKVLLQCEHLDREEI